jgi:hypothetical protein
MKYFCSFLISGVFLLSFSTGLDAQNRSLLFSFSLGAGYSGFKIEDPTEGDLKGIFYPTGGLQIQKRISPSWAINIYPSVSLSGNRIMLDNPSGNITELRSTSAFVNLSIHPKYYINSSVYCTLGPEISYLLWNYGSTFNDDERQSNTEETIFFNRTNFLMSAALGISKKVAESRRNAPVQIDALWYLELRVKQGITNILNDDFFGNDVSSTISAIELVTGISFASKK